MGAVRRIRAGAVAAVVASLWWLAGCGEAGPKTHRVNGRVELAGGNAGDLAGATVEAALESNTTTRASGVIQPDGTFKLETLHNGVILKGAMEGKYQVRILNSDDDDVGNKKARRAALNKKYTKFDTAGLSFEVPAEGEVVLKLAPK